MGYIFNKKAARELRIPRLKLQVEVMELERLIEMAYQSGNRSPEWMKEAERIIKQGKDLLEKTKLG